MADAILTPEKVFITDGFPDLTYVSQGGGQREKEWWF